MRDIEKVKDFFIKDRFAMVTTGIEIVAVDEGYAKCCLKIDDRHVNATGQVMGGAIYTLADFVFAVATNTEDSITVTAVSQISYLGPVKGDTLVAETRLLKNGKRNCFYEIDITDNLGNAVAVVSTNGVHI